jgi:hypothetical protein
MILNIQWEVHEREGAWRILCFYLSIYLTEVEKTTKNITSGEQSRGRHSYWRHRYIHCIFSNTEHSGIAKTFWFRAKEAMCCVMAGLWNVLFKVSVEFPSFYL